MTLSDVTYRAPVRSHLEYANSVYGVKNALSNILLFTSLIMREHN
jgi:hypothetical protein